MQARLTPANIEWRNDVPYSVDFDDIYFSRQDGFEETRYTFIDGNQCIERWQNYNKSCFSVIELGFGTGLNFLSTLWHWQQFRPDNTKLIYRSIEKFPLTHQDLTKAIQLWPMFNTLASPLIEHYPLPLQGIWKIAFPELGAELHLMWMDVQDALYHIYSNNIKADAWYLDGFAPAKNKDIWQQAAFNTLSMSSHPEATLATFTAAGFVRRGLMEAGFNIEKRKGFGQKREMLIGKIATPDNASEDRRNTSQQKPTLNKKIPAWYQPPTLKKTINSIAVIGSGIAGATTARKLAEAGFTVTVFDQASTIANGASGNSSGIYYPFLSKDINLTTQFFLNAYHRLLHDLDYYDLNQHSHSVGVLKLCESKHQAEDLINAYSEKPPLTDVASSNDMPTSTNQDANRWFTIEKATFKSNEKNAERWGVLFPKSGYLSPQSICTQLLNHKNITLKLNHKVIQLKRLKEQWQCAVNDSSSEVATEKQSFDAIILCNSFDADALLPGSFLPAIKVRGQTCYLSEGDIETADKLSFRELVELNNPVICDHIYMFLENEYFQNKSLHSESLQKKHFKKDSSQNKKRLYLGATFEQDSAEEKLLQKSQQNLLSQFETLSGIKTKADKTLNGRVGFRYCSVDRLPMVGPVPNASEYLNNYRQLWKGAPEHRFSTSEYWPGLYINIAHGARGITSSFLSASLITEYLSGAEFSLTNRLVQAVHPARFLIKELKKHPSARLPKVKQLSTALTHSD